MIQIRSTSTEEQRFNMILQAIYKASVRLESCSRHVGKKDFVIPALESS